MGSNALASGNSSWGMHLPPTGRFVSAGGGVEPRRETIVDVDTSTRMSYTGVDTASGDRLRECPVNTLGDFPRARSCGTDPEAGSDNAQTVRISLLEAECAGVRNRNTMLHKHAMLLEIQKMDHVRQIAQLQLKVGGLEAELRMLRAARGVGGDTKTGALAVSPLALQLKSHERLPGLAELGYPAREVRPAQAAARGVTVMDREQGRHGDGGAVSHTSPRRNETSQAAGGISGLALQQNPLRRFSAEAGAKCFRDSGVPGALGEIVDQPGFLPASAHAEGRMNERSPRLQASPSSEDPPPTRRVSGQACTGLRVERTSLSSMPPDADSTLHVQRATGPRVPESRERPTAVVGQTEMLKSTSSASAHNAAATTAEDLRPPPSHPLQDFWAAHTSSSRPNKRPVVKAEPTGSPAPSATDAPTSPCPSAWSRRSESRLPSEKSGDTSQRGSSFGDEHGMAQATAEKLASGGDLKRCSEAGAAAIALPSRGHPPSDVRSHTDPASFDDGQVLMQTPAEASGTSVSSETCAAALPCEISSAAKAATTAERKPSPALRWALGAGAGVDSRDSHVPFCARCSETPSSSLPVGLCEGCPRIICADCLLQGLEGKSSLMLEGLDSATRALLQWGKGDFYILECPSCLDESDKELPPPPQEVPPMTHLLEELLRHDLSRSFRSPMDAAEHPTFLESGGRASMMDLGSMMSKLRNNKYPRRRGPGQFMEDLRRIWRNCRRIGGCDELGQPKPGTNTVSGVVRCALILDAMSEKFFAAHMSDQGGTVWPESAWDCYRQRKQQANTEARLKQLERRESVVRAAPQPREEPAAAGVPDHCTLTVGERTTNSDCEDGSVRERGFDVEKSERAQCKRASEGSMADGLEKAEKRQRTVVPGASKECSSVSPSSVSALVGAPQQVDCVLLDELCDVAVEFATACVTTV